MTKLDPGRQGEGGPPHRVGAPSRQRGTVGSSLFHCFLPRPLAYFIALHCTAGPVATLTICIPSARHSPWSAADGQNIE